MKAKLAELVLSLGVLGFGIALAIGTAGLSSAGGYARQHKRAGHHAFRDTHNLLLLVIVSAIFENLLPKGFRYVGSTTKSPPRHFFR